MYIFSSVSDTARH
ncbi:pollen-specific leucine-rich repeat extensin-like protein 3 [Iris pallida]|uniref:Pollen-specific leucine-rich repeat extensin-like protein 3 n=1 Tax=Iris pallida TaxID=29817 RepID=A0AAX6H921_IRIPA|nr:pollen-specific leucine-rich repeat extensin-like protein 3 [Iris pallida]